MIFVTVGTHEQPFNRLIQKVDELKRDGIIKDDVIIQTGFSTYEPNYCQWSKLIPYQQMVKNVADARIVITHGGPASFIMPLQIKKIPIVVPRQYQFNEHVNDHQLEFARNVAQRMGTYKTVKQDGNSENHQIYHLKKKEGVIFLFSSVLTCQYGKIQTKKYQLHVFRKKN